jgi:hypothetical protein
MAAKSPTHYCAFVDILGFRQLMSDLSGGRLSTDDIEQIMARMQMPDISRPDHKPSDVRVQSISDAVVLSSALNATGLLSLFWALSALARWLLLRGYLVRGAIVRGRLFHDDKMVFGEGLVEAYRIESIIARYPRIIVTRPVPLDVQRYSKDDVERAVDFHDVLKDSVDGPKCLNVLWPIIRGLQEIKARYGAGGGERYIKPVYHECQQMRDQLQRRLDESGTRRTIS